MIINKFVTNFNLTNWKYRGCIRCTVENPGSFSIRSFYWGEGDLARQ